MRLSTLVLCLAGCGPTGELRFPDIDDIFNPDDPDAVELEDAIPPQPPPPPPPPLDIGEGIDELADLVPSRLDGESGVCWVVRYGGFYQLRAIGLDSGERADVVLFDGATSQQEHTAVQFVGDGFLLNSGVDLVHLDVFDGWATALDVTGPSLLHGITEWNGQFTSLSEGQAVVSGTIPGLAAGGVAIPGLDASGLSDVKVVGNTLYAYESLAAPNRIRVFDLPSGEEQDSIELDTPPRIHLGMHVDADHLWLLRTTAIPGEWGTHFIEVHALDGPLLHQVEFDDSRLGGLHCQ